MYSHAEFGLAKAKGSAVTLTSTLFTMCLLLHWTIPPYRAGSLTMPYSLNSLLTRENMGSQKGKEEGETVPLCQWRSLRKEKSSLFYLPRRLTHCALCTVQGEEARGRFFLASGKNRRKNTHIVLGHGAATAATRYAPRQARNGEQQNCQQHLCQICNAEFRLKLNRSFVKL